MWRERNGGGGGGGGSGGCCQCLRPVERKLKIVTCKFTFNGVIRLVTNKCSLISESPVERNPQPTSNQNVDDSNVLLSKIKKKKGKQFKNGWTDQIELIFSVHYNWLININSINYQLPSIYNQNFIFIAKPW